MILARMHNPLLNIPAEITGFLFTVFYGNVILEPIHYQEKIINVGVGCLTALIIAVAKRLFPNGLNRGVRHVKRVIKKVRQNKK